MGDLGDKAQEFGGKAKEGIGEAVGNDDLANEGRADQVKAQRSWGRRQRCRRQGSWALQKGRLDSGLCC